MMNIFQNRYKANIPTLGGNADFNLVKTLLKIRPLQLTDLLSLTFKIIFAHML